MNTDQQQQATDRPVHPVVNKMNPKLKRVFLKIEKLWDDAAGNELAIRHAIGGLVREVMSDEGKYGKNVLATLAQALDVKPDYLYRCRTLFLTWTLESLEALRTRRNKNGRQIEYWHLVLIAVVPVSATRELLIEEFFDKGLTTRQLIDRVKELIGQSKRGQLPRPKSPSAGLASMRKTAADYLEKSPTWHDVVFDPIEEVISNERDTSYLEELIATKTSHEEVMQQVQKNIEKLDQCIRLAKQSRQEKRKAKRHPKTTTPSRPSATGRPTKRKATIGRRSVEV